MADAESPFHDPLPRDATDGAIAVSNVDLVVLDDDAFSIALVAQRPYLLLLLRLQVDVDVPPPAKEVVAPHVRVAVDERAYLAAVVAAPVVPDELLVLDSAEPLAHHGLAGDDGVVPLRRALRQVCRDEAGDLVEAVDAVRAH